MFHFNYTIILNIYYVSFLLGLSIYPRELQLNKTNTSDRHISFLGINIIVIGSNIHTSVYDERDDLDFL